MLETINWVDLLGLTPGDRKLMKVEKVIHKLKSKTQFCRLYHSVVGQSSFVWLSTDAISINIASYTNRFDGEWYWNHFLKRNNYTATKVSTEPIAQYSLEYTDI